MKVIKATQSFTYNGNYYEKNDVVNIKNVKDLVRLNENGFIEPLTPKDIQNFANEIKKEG